MEAMDSCVERYCFIVPFQSIKRVINLIDPVSRISPCSLDTRSSYPMKHFFLKQAVFPMLVALALAGCDTVQDESLPSHAATNPSLSTDASLLAIAVGDRVETVDETTVYERANESSTVVGVLEAEEAGKVLVGPRTRSGITWFQVDFDAGIIGYVTEEHLVLEDDGGGDPPPPPPPPPAGDIMVGLAGCSLERETNDGFKLVSSAEEDEWTWPRDATTYFSGGHLDNWANPNDGIWDDWTNAYATYGADVIHVMPCIRGPESGKSKARSEDVPWPIDDEVEQMIAWIDNLEVLAPGVPIYISGQPDYLENPCETTGVHGPAAMDSLAKVMVAEGRALQGPLIGPLVNLPEGTPGDETRPLDECHPNFDGAMKVGNQFRDWIIELIGLN